MLASAKKLVYDPKEIDSLPVSVTESFCGVGNLQKKLQKSKVTARVIKKK